jgi:hypothetical protein
MSPRDCKIADVHCYNTAISSFMLLRGDPGRNLRTH